MSCTSGTKLPKSSRSPAWARSNSRLTTRCLHEDAMRCSLDPTGCFPSGSSSSTVYGREAWRSRGHWSSRSPSKCTSSTMARTSSDRLTVHSHRCPPIPGCGSYQWVGGEAPSKLPRQHSSLRGKFLAGGDGPLDPDLLHRKLRWTAVDGKQRENTRVLRYGLRSTTLDQNGNRQTPVNRGTVVDK